MVSWDQTKIKDITVWYLSWIPIFLQDGKERNNRPKERKKILEQTKRCCLYNKQKY